jgi:DNA helicase-2/ATP-dependent DNA helicase PcrA
VGITRAMRRLVLSYAESRRLHGRETMNGMSRFVREVPAELLVEVRPRLHVSRPLSAGAWGDRPRTFAGAGAAGPGAGHWGGKARPAHGSFGYSGGAGGAARELEAEGGFRLGQRVRHPSFGEGVVIDFEGHGAQARINVRFAGAGAKWLLVSLANLQPL